MTRQHENKLTMYFAIQTFLENNAAKIGGLAALVTVVGLFKALVTKIKDKMKEIDQAATGKTKVKAEAEEALLDELIPAISALGAYAHAEGKTELEAKADVSESTFRRMRDTEVVPKATGLADLLEQNIAHLADYGVTAEAVASVRVKIEAFASSIGEKESGISERTGARKALFDLFDEADVLLERRLDPLMENFRKKDLELYNSYGNARSIKKLGIGTSAAPAATPTPQPAPAK